jgi:hypothetical protein
MYRGQTLSTLSEIIQGVSKFANPDSERGGEGPSGARKILRKKIAPPEEDIPKHFKFVQYIAAFISTVTKYYSSYVGVPFLRKITKIFQPVFKENALQRVRFFFNFHIWTTEVIPYNALNLEFANFETPCIYFIISAPFFERVGLNRILD